MKKRAEEETTPITTIYHEALQEVAQCESRETIAPILPTFRSMKYALYRKRHKRLPPLPQSTKDLDFGGGWSKNHNGDDFMLGSCSLPMPISLSLQKPPHSTWMELFRSILTCFTTCSCYMPSNMQQFVLVYLAY